MLGPGREPILVTGAPRSGTTWVARLVATGRGTAMTGREPMNPKPGQYALGGTLTGWARIQEPTPRQRRALRTAYLGVNPRTFGRYGRHQLRAPLPTTRVVVKDPFALLSTAAVAEVTGADVVVVYRHPGAVLTSYRRMGWTADLDELRAVGLPLPEDVDDLTDAEQMAHFWADLYAVALEDLARVPRAVVMAHHELAAGGQRAAEALLAALRLRPSDDTASEMSDREPGSSAASPSGPPAPGSGTALHRLDRSPAEVARSWKRHASDEDVATVERITGDVLARLEDLRLRVE